MPSRVSIPTVSRTRFFTLILLSGNLPEDSDTTLLPKRRQTKPGKCVPEVESSNKEKMGSLRESRPFENGCFNLAVL